MADMFETVIGMAEPALGVVAGLVESVKSTVQGFINTSVAEAMKAAGAQGGGDAAAYAAPAAEAAPARGPARVRPLRAPGR